MRSAPGPEATEASSAGLSRHDMVAPCATLGVQILEYLISPFCRDAIVRVGCVVGACGVRELTVVLFCSLETARTQKTRLRNFRSSGRLSGT